MKGWSEDEIRNRTSWRPAALLRACASTSRQGQQREVQTVMGTCTDETRDTAAWMHAADPPKKLYGTAPCAPSATASVKGFYSCHQCQDWPCDQIRNFGFATGRQVMMQTIPVWRRKWRSSGRGSS